MLDTIFNGLFDSAATRITLGNFLLCIAVSLVLGLILALAYMYKTRYSKSFVITLAALPAIVCVIIMMVNGNIGAGVAVAGTFSLVKFRSAPGTAKEIVTLFLAMGTGLVTGMGYLGFAALYTVILCGVYMLYNRVDFGTRKNTDKYKILHITIPEDLDYAKIFDNILGQYTSSAELTGVKTTNMGSLFRLTYEIVLKDPTKEKEMIDELRCRNGNLEINLSKQPTSVAEL